MPAVPEATPVAGDGVLVVDKPAGLTSHDVVAWARRMLGVRRVGHVGTLDPLATGVLPLVVGRATRLATLLAGGLKTYRAVIRLGLQTDTYDATGTPQPGPPDAAERAGSLGVQAVAAACDHFTGTFPQLPPAYSAKKVRGVRAYRLARRQQPVDLRPVEVSVQSFDVIALREGRLECRVVCSPGFYMRTLAHDLGAQLGCGGCLEQLRRECSGPFTLEDAVDMRTAADGARPLRERLIPLAGLLPDLPAVVVTPQGALRTSHGNLLGPGDIDTAASRLPSGGTADVKVYDAAGSLLAIAASAPGGALHPRIVLV